MIPDDRYDELIQFLGQQFDLVWQRFDAVEGRLSKLEVSFEQFREDVRAMGERQRSDPMD